MIKLPLNKIVKGDCIKTMQSFPDNSIDLIFADPPYFLQLENTLKRPDDSTVEGVDDDWDKYDSFSDFDDFSIKWLSEAKRILKDTGTIWVSGTYHNIFRIGKIMQDINFWILNDIVWVKTNPMPNFKGTRFANAHETLIWASKSNKSKYCFNYHTLKQINEDKQMRSDWFMPICSGKERIKIDGKTVHPTQKPEALLYRIILGTTEANGVVLDPFFGSGTTGAVCKKLGRNFIGLEMEDKYIKASTERIENIKETVELETLKLHTPRAVRIPIGRILEENMLEVGDLLYSPKGTHVAKLMSNGMLQHKGNIYSIHQLSAILQDKSSSNGWSYWYYKDNNTSKYVSIDKLRKRIEEREKETQLELDFEDKKDLNQQEQLIFE